MVFCNCLTEVILIGGVPPFSFFFNKKREKKGERDVRRGVGVRACVCVFVPGAGGNH